MWTDPQEMPGLGPGFSIGFIMGASCTITMGSVVALIWWLL